MYTTNELSNGVEEEELNLQIVSSLRTRLGDDVAFLPVPLLLRMYLGRTILFERYAALHLPLPLLPAAVRGRHCIFSTVVYHISGLLMRHKPFNVCL